MNVKLPKYFGFVNKQVAEGHTFIVFAGDDLYGLFHV